MIPLNYGWGLPANYLERKQAVAIADDTKAVANEIRKAAVK